MKTFACFIIAFILTNMNTSMGETAYFDTNGNKITKEQYEQILKQRKTAPAINKEKPKSETKKFQQKQKAAKTIKKETKPIEPEKQYRGMKSNCAKGIDLNAIQVEMFFDLEKKGLLKLEPQFNKAYVAPVIWNKMQFRKKKSLQKYWRYTAVTGERTAHIGQRYMIYIQEKR